MNWSEYLTGGGVGAGFGYDDVSDGDGGGDYNMEDSYGDSRGSSRYGKRDYERPEAPEVNFTKFGDLPTTVVQNDWTKYNVVGQIQEIFKTQKGGLMVKLMDLSDRGSSKNKQDPLLSMLSISDKHNVDDYWGKTLSKGDVLQIKNVTLWNAGNSSSSRKSDTIRVSMSFVAPYRGTGGTHIDVNPDNLKRISPKKLAISSNQPIVTLEDLISCSGGDDGEKVRILCVVLFVSDFEEKGTDGKKQLKLALIDQSNTIINLHWTIGTSKSPNQNSNNSRGEPDIFFVAGDLLLITEVSYFKDGQILSIYSSGSNVVFPGYVCSTWRSRELGLPKFSSTKTERLRKQRTIDAYNEETPLYDSLHTMFTWKRKMDYSHPPNFLWQNYFENVDGIKYHSKNDIIHIKPTKALGVNQLIASLSGDVPKNGLRSILKAKILAVDTTDFVNYICPNQGCFSPLKFVQNTQGDIITSCIKLSHTLSPEEKPRFSATLYLYVYDCSQVTASQKQCIKISIKDRVICQLLKPAYKNCSIEDLLSLDKESLYNYFDPQYLREGSPITLAILSTSRSFGDSQKNVNYWHTVQSVKKPASHHQSFTQNTDTLSDSD